MSKYDGTQAKWNKLSKAEQLLVEWTNAARMQLSMQAELKALQKQDNLAEAQEVTIEYTEACLHTLKVEQRIRMFVDELYKTP